MQKKLFAVCLLLFLAHQFIQKILKINLPVIDNYLDPFLCMPVLLYGHLSERNLFSGENVRSLSATTIIMATVLISFVSEFCFPEWSEKFTRDGLDILAFGAGAVFFHFFMNKTEAKSKQV